MPSSELIDDIRHWHRQRVFMMEQRKRMNLALGAHIRTMLGYRTDLPDAERKEIAKKADEIITECEALVVGKREELSAAAADYGPIVTATIQARAPFDALERRCIKEMEAAAKQLPVWQMMESVRGFGPLSLAQIIGETGDLSNYATRERVWKRLGLAVIDGTRQGGLTKGASKEDWIAHGYNPKRRSIMWNIGQALIRAGGAYAELYRARKAYEVQKAGEEGLTVKPAAEIKAAEKAECRSVGHIANRAQRVMEKQLLEDLHAAWHDTEGEMEHAA